MQPSGRYIGEGSVLDTWVIILAFYYGMLVARFFFCVREVDRISEIYKSSEFIYFDYNEFLISSY